MKIRRRDFIKAASGIALGSIADSISSFASLRESSPAAKPKVAVFFEPSFPAENGMNLDRPLLERALAGYDVTFLGVSGLKEQLNASSFQLLLMPYGSAFPKESWNALSLFLREGGNWLNLGGVPFSRPVRKGAGGWRKEVHQTVYHKRLGITQSFPVSTKEIKSFRGSGALEESQEWIDGIKPQEIYELYVRFAVTKDFPTEDGSPGPRDAHLHPLVTGLGNDEQRLAAPIVQIDRLQGDYAGGRWLLANYSGSISAEAIRMLADIALQGAVDFSVRTSFACYFGGELPSVTVRLHRPKGDVEQLTKHECEVDVVDGKGKLLELFKVRLQGKGTVALGTATLSGTKKLTPGFYRLAASLKLSSSAQSIKHTTGFWVHDQRLMGSGKPLSLDSNYFLRDGKPYPVTGTTYMISDVHRKFLFEPNPYLWDRDFAEMKRAGINMVRTGLWTGWRNFMLDVGTPNEAPLRALDAFVLTARKYDIPIIFTFFAFLPEQWGGENAYIDPRAINAQKEFVTSIAHRFRSANDILWDLINEPSFCSPHHMWICRPNYDRFEQAAWEQWLKERVRAESDDERLAQLQEFYRASADEPSSLPSLEDFSNPVASEEHRPVKVVDYRLFGQEMFQSWIEHMTAAIRSNGNAHQLITVGQDEGGTYDRPNPQFFSDRVDFTCIHNWWLHDDLVWDNVVTKAPNKPNLVEETGAVFYEKMDGSALRTEDEVAWSLERKLAISLGVAGAGFLEWIWNTNPFMKSDGEAAIGLFRVDGTEKPELRLVTEYARFFAAHKQLIAGKQDEEVVMVLPHSNMFSTRNHASEATKQCVRMMYYYCNVPMRAVSEYRLNLVRDIPRLIILPSPRVLNEQAWIALLKIVEKGSSLLLTGVIDADEYWIDQPRIEKFGIEAMTRPVTQAEFLAIESSDYRLSYRGDKIQRVEKAVIGQSSRPSVMTLQHGKGRILWSPLPVELSDVPDPILALYRFALKEAGINSACEVEQGDPSVLIAPTIFENAVLYALVSECDRDTDVRFVDRASNSAVGVTVRAQRAAMVFVDRKSGKVLAQLN